MCSLFVSPFPPHVHNITSETTPLYMIPWNEIGLRLLHKRWTGSLEMTMMTEPTSLVSTPSIAEYEECNSHSEFISQLTNQLGYDRITFPVSLL